MDFYSLTPKKFEDLCYEYTKKIYENKYYELEHTSYTHDGGRDIEIKFYDAVSEIVVWAECKRHKRNIGLEEIGKNVVLVIANQIHKIIFFSVSSITENAQITISNIANTFNFEVTYIYGKVLEDEIRKYPDIMKHYFPNTTLLNDIPENKIEYYITVSEYKNSSIKGSFDNPIVKLREGNFVYLYVHIKNTTLSSLWKLKVSLKYKDENIEFNKTVLEKDYISGKSDLILEFEGHVVNKKVSFIELPDVLLQYTLSREDVNYISEIRQLPSLDLTKCKNYPLTGKLVHEYLATDVKKLEEGVLECQPGIIDIRGFSGVGKSRIALEIRKRLLSKGFASYQFDCKELFDYDLIRNLFCVLMGLPFSRGDLQHLIAIG